MSQYKLREKLWPKHNVLPEFDLRAIRAPLSAGIASPEDTDWFAALRRLIDGVNESDFDVALIGAGAFSLPLGAYCKSKGKVSVHLGGSLQILFGISGARWEKRSDFAAFMNEHWRKPSAEETPRDFRQVEGGCYW